MNDCLRQKLRVAGTPLARGYARMGLEILKELKRESGVYIRLGEHGDFGLL